MLYFLSALPLVGEILCLQLSAEYLHVLARQRGRFIKALLVWFLGAGVYMAAYAVGNIGGSDITVAQLGAFFLIRMYAIAGVLDWIERVPVARARVRRG